MKKLLQLTIITLIITSSVSVYASKTDTPVEPVIWEGEVTDYYDKLSFEKKELINRIQKTYGTKAISFYKNDVYFSFYKQEKDIFVPVIMSYQKKKVIHTCNENVFEVIGITYNPENKIMYVGENLSGKKAFYKLSNGEYISEYGEYNYVKPIYHAGSRWFFMGNIGAITYQNGYTIGGTWFFIDTANGKEIVTEFDSFHMIDKIQRCDDKWLFSLYSNGSYSYINAEDGKVVGGEFTMVKPITEANGKFYFVGTKNVGAQVFKQCYVSVDTGLQIGNMYYNVLPEIFTINNVNYFIGANYKDNNSFVINMETGTERAGDYSYLTFKKVYPYKKSAVIRANKNSKYYLVDANTGRPISFKYDLSNELQLFNDKTVTIVRDKNRKYSYVDVETQEKISPDYSNEPSDLTNIAGEWLYTVKENRENQIVNLKTGKAYKGDYGYLYDFYDIDGEAVVKAQKDRKFFYTYIKDGKPIGKIFDTIGKLVNIGNTWVFSAEDNGKFSYIDVKTGKDIGKQYSFVGEIQQAGDSFVFYRLKDDKLAYMDAKTGKKLTDEYDEVSNIYQAGETYVFIATDGNKKFVVDVLKNKKIGKGYSAINDTFSQSGSFWVFSCYTGDKISYINMSNGKPIGDSYKQIGQVTEAGFKRVFYAIKDDGETFIDMGDGKQIGKNYEIVKSDIHSAFGIFVYKANNNGKWFYIDTATGKKIWGEYDVLDNIEHAGTATFFKASENKKWFYINCQDGSLMGETYDEVKQIVGHGNLISFEARIGNKWKKVEPFKIIQYRGMEFKPSVDPIYPSFMNMDDRRGGILGTAVLTNPLDEDASVSIQIKSPDFPKFYGEDSNSFIGSELSLGPKESTEANIYLPFSRNYWENTQDTFVQMSVIAKITSKTGIEGKQEHTFNTKIAARNKLKWRDIRDIAHFGSINDPVVIAIADLVSNLNDVKDLRVPPKIEKAMKGYEVCRAIGLNYSYMSLGLGDEDEVLLPFEIYKKKSGKCTDTTMLYASVLSRLGYSVLITNFEHKKASHVMLLIDTGLDSEDYRYLEKDKNSIISGDLQRCYIPIETTGLASGQNHDSYNFLKAWEKGMIQYNGYKNQILDSENTFRLDSAWKYGYSPMEPGSEVNFRISDDKIESMTELIFDEFDEYSENHLQDESEENKLKSKLNDNNAGTYFNLGKYYFTTRLYTKAEEYFQKASDLKQVPDHLYYLCAIQVLKAKSQLIPLSMSEKRKSKKEFLKNADVLSDLLISSKNEMSQKMFDMNTDLSKWYRAFSKKEQSEVHTKIASAIKEELDKKTKTAYNELSADKLKSMGYTEKGLRELKEKGFSEDVLVALAVKGFSEEEILSSASKGFSEEEILSSAAKGFSEDAIVSSASKGFSEDAIISAATKGFSEDAIISSASKGFSEEVWDVSIK